MRTIEPIFQKTVDNFWPDGRWTNIDFMGSTDSQAELNIWAYWLEQFACKFEPNRPNILQLIINLTDKWAADH